MSNNVTTLEYGGVEMSLSAWGIRYGTPVCRYVNDSPDEYSFFIGGGSSTAQPAGVLAAVPAGIQFKGKCVRRIGRTGSGTSWSGGTQRFVGWLSDAPKFTTSGGEAGYSYSFLGPYWWIENTQYQQPSAAKIYSTDMAISFPYSTSLLLFTRVNLPAPLGNPAFRDYQLCSITNGEQIQDALQFVLDNLPPGMDPPFQFDSTGRFSTQTGTNATPLNSGIEPNLALPSLPSLDQPVHTVIRDCLEISPDVTIGFDYTTSPPTFKALRRSSMASVTAVLTGSGKPKDFAIQKRCSRVPASVVIYYIITDTLDGKPSVRLGKDKWGPAKEAAFQGAGGGAHGLAAAALVDSDPNGGPFVIGQCFDLTGMERTTGTFYQTIETLPAINNSVYPHEMRDFWATMHVRFRTWKTRNLTFLANDLVDSNRTPITADNYPWMFTGPGGAFKCNFLTSGVLSDWMCQKDGTPINAVRATITSEILFDSYDVIAAGAPDPYVPSDTNYITYNSDNKTGTLVSTTGDDDPLVISASNIILTDAESGNYAYTDNASITYPEPIPSGIAQTLYESLANLPEFEGSVTNVEANIPGTATTLNTLNVSGGESEWLTMKAQIQQLTENDSTGETSVTFGPPNHIGAEDLLRLFRMWSHRLTWYNPMIRVTGQI